MATASLGGTLRKVFARVRQDAGGDGELLTRYRTGRDQDAFGSLVRRHGPMVLGVCRRVLRDCHAADDAFQATFLVLARKADAVRPPDRLAPWLYGVAYRTALKARGRAFRRQQVEQEYAADLAGRGMSAPRYDGDADAADLLPAIDEQLNALPEKYRTPLVLCGIQGLNKAEAAEKLGLPEGTVSSRLARAREMLRDRLTRRGYAVPAAALAALFTADTLQAAVPAALAEAAAATATGATAASATVLALSHEVLRSMTLLKLQFLGAVALSATLAGGGFVALTADEKKPQPAPGDVKKPQPAPADVKKPQPAPGDPVKNPPKPDAEKPAPTKPGEKPAKPAPEGEKPGAKPAPKVVGRVASVDPKANTITLAAKGDGGATEKVVKLAAAVKVFIDGKEAKLADVPKDSFAALASAGTKDGTPPEVTEVRVTGPSFVAVVKQVSTEAITLDGGEKGDRVFKLAPGGQVTVNGKPAPITDIKAGDKAAVTLTAAGTAALTVGTGTKPEGGEKPGAKPGKFAGKVGSVDAKAGTITLVAKGEGGLKETVVKVAADAKITIDGKAAKLADIPKGVVVAFGLVPTKEGQPREANEVTVAGPTFFATVKQVDAAGLTVSGEKAGDRAVKLAPAGKVQIGEKEGKLADVKAGDRVAVTLTADESAAVLVVVGKKPTGDKPKPDKEEEDEE